MPCPAAGSVDPRAAATAEMEPGQQGSPGDGWVLCPGCRQSTGPPRALCPDCGSRLPQPAKADSAGALLVAGLVIGAIGYAIYAATGHGSFGAVVLLIGIIAFGVGLAQSKNVAGRIGPERQSSCCGCSCAVALFVVPVGATLLWSHGGPAMAALVLPAWVPLSWVAAGLSAGVDTVRRKFEPVSDRERAPRLPCR